AGPAAENGLEEGEGGEEDGREGEGEEEREGEEDGREGEEGEEDLDDELDASQLERFMKDRRRATSLPAYPAALLLGGSTCPHGRKHVKFADSMGLTLASVKTFSSLEEPRVPSTVLSRHNSFPQSEPRPGFRPGSLGADRLVACFPESRDTERRVQRLRVCLEKVAITQFEVRGQIRVLSGGGAGREVGVRYTFNDWLSHVDAQALPVAAEPPQGLLGERFSFTLYTPPFMGPGAAVHLAVYLRGDGGEFWDNNEGQNYSLQYRCMPGPPTYGSAAFST
ncbi:protein phosphatase 1 regulatory subunit 3G, partial [Etheostoma cragini]|uniref:protein phosphatase 1 regulatory subunit 3G n=1 Tax=Etheostoma cragini TaxID=417921 RepID=UPI00155EA518